MHVLQHPYCFVYLSKAWFVDSWCASGHPPGLRDVLTSFVGLCGRLVLFRVGVLASSDDVFREKKTL